MSVLIDRTTINAITILEDGQLQIQRVRRIFDGITLVGEQYHRHVLVPGATITNEDARVVAIATLLWTPTVIAAYQQAQAQKTPIP